jgi:indole-3-glycerol phosphate synthase
VAHGKPRLQGAGLSGFPIREGTPSIGRGPVSRCVARMYDQTAMADVLREIVDHKRIEVDRAKSALPAAELERRRADAPPVRGFAAALAARGPLALIAEVKRASPSAGLIRSDIDPVVIAADYERFGAACLSVLTDQKFFQGSLDDLIQVRQAVSIPVLRKDFLIDRYQVLEARAAGADCVLLIAECLDHCRLRELYFFASELGMDALVEIYDADNLERVLELEPAMVGINNRNLRTFVTDLEHTLRLAPRVASQTLLVSESGIRAGDDVARLQAAGVRAILVGETLMRAADLGTKMAELLTPRARTQSRNSRP